MKRFNKKVHAIMWAFQIAWRIDKKMLMLWLIISSVLSVLPAIAISLNREVIRGISKYLSTGQGEYYDSVYAIVVLGIIMTIQGLSNRVNGDLLYMMMYDSYYLGMEELIMEAVNDLDMITFLNKAVKDEYNAIIRRAGSLTDFISSLCVLVSKIIGIISLLIVALQVSVLIFLISLGYVAVTIFSNAKYTHKVRQDIKKIRDNERVVSHLQNMPLSLGIAKEIRLFNSKKKIIKQWEHAYRLIEHHKVKRFFGLEFRSFISGIGFYIFMTGIIVYSIYQVAEGRMFPDVFLMIYMLCENIAKSIVGIANSFLKADYGLYALERQQDFILSISKKRKSDNTLISYNDSIKTIFEMKNVYFGYEANKMVLKNINLKINKSEIVALIGCNGSGKTTLTKLLLNLYKPTQGDILFYGQSYKNYKNGFINSCIGAFFQDFYLFHASLKENIGLGDCQHIHNEPKIMEALSKGGALRILNTLPQKLHHWIGKDVNTDGALLSGGERQKLAVSRAYMRDRHILIFDEPAAALDPLAEMEQFMNIKKHIGGQTAILISHRVGFAKLADRIIVLGEDGHLIEHGCHKQLIAKDGVYAKLYYMQAKWYDSGQI